MQFAEKMAEIRDKLDEMGHEAFITGFTPLFLGKTVAEKEKIKSEQRAGDVDTIREFWNLMHGADAVLVLNLEKNCIKNYIGANSLMEIGFAHVLGQRIFLLNPIPDMPYCREELEAVHPIVIDGDLTKIK